MIFKCRGTARGEHVNQQDCGALRRVATAKTSPVINLSFQEGYERLLWTSQRKATMITKTLTAALRNSACPVRTLARFGRQLHAVQLKSLLRLFCGLERHVGEPARSPRVLRRTFFSTFQTEIPAKIKHNGNSSNAHEKETSATA